MKNFLISLCSVLIWSAGWYFSTLLCPIVCAYVAPYLPSWRVLVFLPAIVPILSIVGLFPLGIAFGICKWLATMLEDRGKKMDFVMLLTSSVLGCIYYVIRLIDFLHQCRELNPYHDMEELVTIEWIMCVFMVGYLIGGAIYIVKGED